MVLDTLLAKEPDLRPIVEAINHQQRLVGAGSKLGLYLHRNHAFAAENKHKTNSNSQLPAAQQHVDAAGTQQVSALQITLGPATCKTATDDCAHSTAVAGATAAAAADDALQGNTAWKACCPALSVIALLAEALVVQYDTSNSSSSSSGQLRQHLEYVPRSAALLHTTGAVAEPGAVGAASLRATGAHMQQAQCMCDHSSAFCCDRRPAKRRCVDAHDVRQQYTQQAQEQWEFPNINCSCSGGGSSSSSIALPLPSRLQHMTNPHLVLMMCESFPDKTVLGGNRQHKQQRQQQQQWQQRQQQQQGQQNNISKGSATSDSPALSQLLQQELQQEPGVVTAAAADEAVRRSGAAASTGAAQHQLPASRMLDCSLQAGVLFGVMRSSQAAADAIAAAAAAACNDSQAEQPPPPPQQQQVSSCSPVFPVMWAAVPLTPAAAAGADQAYDTAAFLPMDQYQSSPTQITLTPAFVSARAAGNTMHIALHEQQQQNGFRMEVRSAAAAALTRTPNFAFRWGHVHVPILLQHQQRLNHNPMPKQPEDTHSQQHPVNFDFIYGLKSYTNGCTSLKSYMTDFAIPDSIAQRLAAAAAGAGSSTRSKRGQPKVLRLQLSDMTCPLCFSRSSRFSSVQALRAHFECCHQQFECAVKEPITLEVSVRHGWSKLSTPQEHLPQQPYFWSKKQRTASWWQQQGLRPDRDLRPAWAKTAATTAARAAAATAAAAQRRVDCSAAAERLRVVNQRKRMRQQQKGAALSGAEPLQQPTSSHDYDSTTGPAAAAADAADYFEQRRQQQRKNSRLSGSAAAPAAAGGGRGGGIRGSLDMQGDDDNEPGNRLLEFATAAPSHNTAVAAAAADGDDDLAEAATTRRSHKPLQEQQQQQQLPEELVKRFLGVMYHSQSMAPLTAAGLAGGRADDEIDYDHYRVQQLRAWHAEGKTTISERHFMLAWNRYVKYPSLSGPAAIELTPELIYNWAVYAAPKCSLNPDLERCYMTHLITLHKFGHLGPQDLAKCLKELRTCHDAGVKGQGLLSDWEVALEGADGTQYNMYEDNQQQQQQQLRQRKRRSKSTTDSAAGASGDLQQLIEQQQQQQQQEEQQRQVEVQGNPEVPMETSPSCEMAPLEVATLPGQVQQQQQQQQRRRRLPEMQGNAEVAMETSPSCKIAPMEGGALPGQVQQQPQKQQLQQQRQLEMQGSPEVTMEASPSCETSPVQVAPLPGQVQQQPQKQQQPPQQRQLEMQGNPEVAMEASPSCEVAPLEVAALPDQVQQQQQRRRQLEAQGDTEVSMEASPSCETSPMDGGALPEQQQQSEVEYHHQQIHLQEDQYQKPKDWHNAAAATSKQCPMSEVWQQAADSAVVDEQIVNKEPPGVVSRSAGPLLVDFRAADASSLPAAAAAAAGEPVAPVCMPLQHVDAQAAASPSSESLQVPETTLPPLRTDTSAAVAAAGGPVAPAGMPLQHADAQAAASPSSDSLQRPETTLAPVQTKTTAAAAAAVEAADPLSDMARSPSPSMYNPAVAGNELCLSVLVKQLVPDGTHSSLSRSVSPASYTMLPQPPPTPAAAPSAREAPAVAAVETEGPVAQAAASECGVDLQAIAADHDAAQQQEPMLPPPPAAAAAAMPSEQRSSPPGRLHSFKRRLTPLLKSAKVLHVQRQPAAAAATEHSVAGQHSIAQFGKGKVLTPPLIDIKAEDGPQSVIAGSSVITTADESNIQIRPLWHGYLMKRSRKFCRLEAWAVQHDSSASVAAVTAADGVDGNDSSVKQSHSLLGRLSMSTLPTVIRADWRVPVEDAVQAYCRCPIKRRRLFWITQQEAHSPSADAAVAAAATNSTVAVASSVATSPSGGDWQGQLTEFIVDLVSKCRCGVAKITNKTSIASDDPAAFEQSQQFYLYLVPPGEEVCRKFCVRQLQDGGYDGCMLGVLVRNRSYRHGVSIKVEGRP